MDGLDEVVGLGIDAADVLGDEFVGSFTGGVIEGERGLVIGEFVDIGIHLGKGAQMVDAFVEATRLAG